MSIATALPPVPTLPAYTFAERLGAGSYATVYRATAKTPDSQTGVRETFAIKCIERRRIAPHSSAVNNLVREIGILRTLRHPHIVTMRDFRWDAVYVYLITEYCSGGDLSKFIQQHRQVAEGIVKRFLQQLGSALQYLRSRNISHMDLKPGNILLSSRQQPIVLKLADFGFATYLRSGMDTSSFHGSPLYMAPEIFTARYHDASADLWSVGIIVYECLFGRAPFAAPTMEELMDQIKNPPPHAQEIVPLPRDRSPPLSEDCSNLLTGLLTRNPSHRITFDAFFSDSWLDLDHAASEENLQKACDICRTAVAADKDGRVSQAVHLYCKSLEYFIPCIHLYSDSDPAKVELRNKITRYIRRAETLKTGANQGPRYNTRPGTAAAPFRRRVYYVESSVSNRPSTSCGASGTDFTDGNSTVITAESDTTLTDKDLLDLWSEIPQVSAATKLIRAAQDLELKNELKTALDKYTLVIESCLKILSLYQQLHSTDNPSSINASLDRNLTDALLHVTPDAVKFLRDKTEEWMAEAEQIRTRMDLQKVSLSCLAEEEKECDVVDESTNQLARDSQCSIQ